MLILAALLAAAAPQAADRQPIIVTGKSLRATADALEQCLQRDCPAEEDIRATLAHAENLFVAGDYKSARSELRNSIRRNGDEAEALPIPVSNLYRANARVSAHLGEGEDYQRSTYRTWSILREGAGVPAWLALSARMDVAEMVYQRQGRLAAKRALQQLAEDALARGRPDFAALARLRAIWIDHLSDPGSNSVERELRAMLAESDPSDGVARTGALVLLARLEQARGTGSAAATDALLAELARTPSDRPALLYSPPLPVLHGDKWNPPDLQRVPTYTVTQSLPTENFDNRWVDIGFWVRPDGRVADVEVLRQSGSPRWVKPVLISIAGRIYAPPAGGQTRYRVERFTYTSNWRQRIDTKLRVRSQDGKIERLDLTADLPVTSGS